MKTETFDAESLMFSAAAAVDRIIFKN